MKALNVKIKIFSAIYWTFAISKKYTFKNL